MSVMTKRKSVGEMTKPFAMPQDTWKVAVIAPTNNKKLSSYEQKVSNQDLTSSWHRSKSGMSEFSHMSEVTRLSEILGRKRNKGFSLSSNL